MNKYYAVHNGRKPGVYKTWEETKMQVTGFPGAVYKRFVFLKDAMHYAKTGTLITHQKTKTKAKARTKKSGLMSIVKGGKTSALAFSASASNTKSKTKSKSKTGLVKTKGSAPASASAQVSHAMISKYTSYLDKFWELNGDGIEDTLVIYTDGSTINNGKVNASGGYGAFFNDPNIMPISEPLKDCKITNNVGELKAIISALTKVASDKRKKLILSDSQYSVLALTKRYKNYEKNGWMTNYKGKSKPVSNAKLIKAALALIRSQQVTIKHIYACHKNPKTVMEVGNWIADRLANQVIPMELFNKNDNSQSLCSSKVQTIEENADVDATD